MIEAVAMNSTARTAAPRDLDPKDVLTDLFEEMRADDPQYLAEMVIQRLRDVGFEIRPTTED